MEKFMEEFNKQYDFIYENEVMENKIKGSVEALERFDNHLTELEKEFLRNFVLFRGDFISSDREAIAFIFALNNQEVA